MATSLLYRELARSLPLSFPSFPHFRRWPIARFADHTCRHAFPIGDLLAGRQGTSFSAPRDPSPTAAVDHAVSASQTPDLNARPRRGEPRSAPEPSGYRSRTRPGHLKVFPLRSFPLSSACASSYSSLPLPHLTPPGRLRSLPSPPAPPPPGSSRPSPRRPRGGPSCPAGALSAVRSTAGAGREAASPCPRPCFPPKRATLGAPLRQKALAPGHLNFHFRLRTKRRCTWTFPGPLCVFKASGGVGVRKPRCLLKVEVTSAFLRGKLVPSISVYYRRLLWWFFKLPKIAQACVTSTLSSVHDAGP